MARLTDILARSAAPILLTVGSLLAVGAILTTLGQTVVGWSIYGIGYVGTLVAFPVVAALGQRQRPLGRLARTGLAMLMTGTVLGVPVMLMMLGFYAQNAPVHDLLMPYVMTPFGMVAGPLAWIGLAVLGAAIVRDRMLPALSGVLFMATPVLAIPVDFGMLPHAAWAAAFVVVFIALGWIARSTTRQETVSDLSGSPAAALRA